MAFAEMTRAKMKGGPIAAGGRAEPPKSGRVQYTDPAVKMHRSWTWWHNGQATRRLDRSCCSGVPLTLEAFPAVALNAHAKGSGAWWLLPPPNW